MYAYQLIDLIRNKKVSIKEICLDFFKQIEEKDKYFKAWEHLNKEILVKNIEDLEEKQQTQQLGKLVGLPVGIKDVFNTKDYPTEMGSSIWKGFTPGNDARTIYDIKREDGIIMGKTVTAEFAVHFLPKDKTVNPHNQLHTPGTSSSGSAVAVATKMIPWALGTQTAGSIIRPASFCGIYGFKPTFGIIPRTGVLKTTDTLDTIGIMANCVEDIEILFDVIRVKGDDFPFAKEVDSIENSHISEKIKIGLVIDNINVFDTYPQYAKKAFDALIARLSAATFVELEEIMPIPEFNLIHELHGIIYDKTLAYYFGSEIKNNHFELSDLIRDSIEKGAMITPDLYRKAISQQADIKQIITKKLQDYDILLTLSTAGAAPLLDIIETPDTCLIWTFLGMPSLNIPLFKNEDGLPYGVQMIAKKYTDKKMLAIAKKIISFLGS